MHTAHSTIDLEQEKVIEEFSQFTDWSDKYEYLIDLGKALPALDEKYKTEFHLVKGCQSKVWLHAYVKEHKLYLVADSDTVITKGIIALLIRVLNGQDIQDIEKAELTFIDAIGLKSHLSPTRSNGLISMIQHIKSYARNLSVTNQSETPSDPESQQALMIRQIKEVYDPEIPVDIWELGLIYTLSIDENGKVQITMTLTSPACPVAGSLPLEVQEKLMQLPFVKDVELSLVWNPAWSKDRMSDEARMALDMF
ncbi:MAG TPA: SufE family protein [Saprospiraceae bacterium]|nr:SufE family protein [Saprospiraceae bacterium]